VATWGAAKEKTVACWVKVCNGGSADAPTVTELGTGAGAGVGVGAGAGAGAGTRAATGSNGTGSEANPYDSADSADEGGGADVDGECR
jgi:hypothetical protein